MFIPQKQPSLSKGQAALAHKAKNAAVVFVWLPPRSVEPSVAKTMTAPMIHSTVALIHCFKQVNTKAAIDAVQQIRTVLKATNATHKRDVFPMGVLLWEGPALRIAIALKAVSAWVCGVEVIV